MLVHDSFSSIGVTLALLTASRPSRRWRYAGRDGSLAEYVADGRGGAASALRQLAQLPWFAYNVALKVLTVLPDPPGALAVLTLGPSCVQRSVRALGGPRGVVRALRERRCWRRWSAVHQARR